MLFALSFFAAGCTHNFDRHWTEIRTKQKGGFNALRDAWIVEEGIPTEEFTLVIQPSDPLTTPKGTFPLSLLKGAQIPLDERFIFAVIDPLNGKTDVRFEFEMGEDGKFKIFDSKGVRTEREIPFVATEGLLTAKPIFYAIASKERGWIAKAEFIPYPLETKTESGARASLIVTHPMLTRFDLRAEGFDPNETVRAIHRTGNKEETLELSADEQGTFILPLNPTMLGRMGGEASIVLVRANEELCLDYPWGARLEKKTFEERSVFPVLFVANREPEEIDLPLVQNSFKNLNIY